MAERNEEIDEDRRITFRIDISPGDFIIEGVDRRAISLSPSAADHYVFYAVLLNFMGRAEEAQNLIRKAMRLSPVYPDLYLGILATGCRLLDCYKEAIAADREHLVRNPENAFSDRPLSG